MKKGILILSLTFLTAFSVMAQQTDCTGSLNSFSFEMFRQLKSDKENLFFSPFSIDIALMMTREGAKSDTKTEFDKVLHMDSKTDTKDVLDFVLKIKSFRDPSNQLTIANAIWVQKDFLINADFHSRIQTNYSADAFPVDFIDHFNSSAQINKWAAQKTTDLIRSVISPEQISDSTKMVLTNAIYFKGTWDKKFDTKLTRKDNFYGMNHDTVRIDFMHETARTGYFENDDFQFISKNYKGYDKSFCVILPKKRYGLSSLETMMDKSIIDSIFRHVVSFNEVDVSIPKFKMETSYTLNESLSKLGLNKAFTDSADFSGISTHSRLKISSVLHKAFIEVNEEKTEAAAVTTTIMNYAIGGTSHLPKPAPKVFKADHPFLFMIIDNQTKGIIFMGKYGRNS